MRAGRKRLIQNTHHPDGKFQQTAYRVLLPASHTASPSVTPFCKEGLTFFTVLAGTYAVLGRRRSRVMREELREGSGLFSILAFMPAQASFGLADDLRRRTSGGASAALMLSHWERLQVLCLPYNSHAQRRFQRASCGG